jgi:hypothetical protein
MPNCDLCGNREAITYGNACLCHKCLSTLEQPYFETSDFWNWVERKKYRQAAEYTKWIDRQVKKRKQK